MRKFVISALVVLSLCGGIGVLSAPVWAESDKELSAKVALLSTQIEKEPRNSKLIGERGRVFVLLFKYDEAISDLTRAIALDPNFIEGDGLMASALIGKGEYAEALKSLDRALSRQKFPHRDELYSLKSLCLHKLKRDRESIQAAKSAIEMNSNNCDAYYWEAASLHRLKGDKSEVLRLLRKCVEINPADVHVAKLIKAVEQEP